MTQNIEIGCLFDLDGVIVDSETQYSLFWDEIEKIYPTGIPDYSMKIKGSTLPTILHKFYATDQIRQDILLRLKSFEDSMPLEIFTGAIDFLEELKIAKIPSAIVTSSTRAKMERLLQLRPQLKTFFAAIIDGDMVTYPKPDPECYLKGAKEIGKHISRCIVFEDSINGIKAGKASGAHVIAISTTLPESELKKLEPDLIIPSFAGFHVSSLYELFS